MSRRVVPAMAICTVLVWAARPSGDAQPPALPSLLTAAAAYVAQYEARASAIVFEERYVQQVNRRQGRLEERELRSEMVVVNFGQTGWIGYRDIFEVDGKPVRDRQDRLQTLFVRPSPDLLDRARAIADEGARFNMGSVQRNFNYPTMALMFLRQEHQVRSTFAREGSERVNGAPAWAITFREIKRPTLIGAARNGDAAASGRFWIEPDTGRVLRSQLTVEEEVASGTIDVVYGTWPGFDVLVPVSMEEDLTVRGRQVGIPVSGPVLAIELVRGRARYTNFKRFSVDVNVDLKMP